MLYHSVVFLDIFLVQSTLLNQNSLFHIQFSRVKFLYFFFIVFLSFRDILSKNTQFYSKKEFKKLGYKHLSMLMHGQCQTCSCNYHVRNVIMALWPYEHIIISMAVINMSENNHVNYEHVKISMTMTKKNILYN